MTSLSQQNAAAKPQADVKVLREEIVLPDSINLVIEMVDYMKDYYAASEYGHPYKFPQPPRRWSAAFIAEAQSIVQCVLRAKRNPVRVDWDAEEYTDILHRNELGSSETRESMFRDVFLPPEEFRHGLTSMTEPMTIIDIHDRILLWYLPNALTKGCQTKLLDISRYLDPLLGSNRESEGRRKRKHASVNSGWLNISPGAHKSKDHTGAEYTLEVSKHMRAILSDDKGPTWLSEGQECLALLSASLSIMHPPLLGAGLQSTFAIRDAETDPSVRAAMDAWPCAFNFVEIITNCCVSRRRSTLTRPEWFDLMCSVGTHSDASLVLDGLNLSLDYSPGTLAAFSPRLIPYSIPMGSPDRIWYTFGMQNTLHKRYRIENPGWVKPDNIAEYIRRAHPT
ncbi:hypothetical protein PsYK624_094550 [Phanerochaete sordida]|uniref:Uncharacterized protein n=1 Tax=Phanerochaete sordida TaxID=48140 RepID=A0A9P3LF83_9APHY|nr:hypothetical protein PsYK624_094550 [Phanerochaete sordida]